MGGRLPQAGAEGVNPGNGVKHLLEKPSEYYKSLPGVSDAMDGMLAGARPYQWRTLPDGSPDQVLFCVHLVSYGMVSTFRQALRCDE